MKNLKDTKIGISDDFLKEIEDMHKDLYPVFRKFKDTKKKVYFKVDKLMVKFTEVRRQRNFSITPKF